MAEMGVWHLVQRRRQFPDHWRSGSVVNPAVFLPRTNTYATYQTEPTYMQVVAKNNPAPKIPTPFHKSPPPSPQPHRLHHHHHSPLPITFCLTAQSIFGFPSHQSIRNGGTCALTVVAKDTWSLSVAMQKGAANARNLATHATSARREC